MKMESHKGDWMTENTGDEHKNNLIENNTEIHGCYKIKQFLGGSSIATTYLATNITNNSPIAVKIFNDILTSEENKQVCFEIAEKYKNLTSCYIVPLLDYGLWDNRIFLVSKFIEGGNLLAAAENHKFSEHKAVKLAIDIVEALDVIEAHNLVHIAIKPQNILLRDIGYSLSDFSFFPNSPDIDFDFLRDECYYFAPEVFDSNGGITLKSDIYSLGIVLYQILTGDNPFFSTSRDKIEYRHNNLTPPRLSEKRSDITEYMSDLVESMLRKNIDERPDLASVKDILSLINDYLRIHPTTEEKSKKDDAVPSDSPEHAASPIKEHSDKETSALHKEDIIKALQEKKHFFLQQKKQSVGLRIQRIILPVLIVLFVMCSGFILYKHIFDNKAHIENIPQSGPMTLVKCKNCSHFEKKQVNDIHLLHCSKCGGDMTIQIECAVCGCHFSLEGKKYDKINNIDDLQKSGIKLKCPVPDCGSEKVIYSATLPVFK